MKNPLFSPLFLLAVLLTACAPVSTLEPHPYGWSPPSLSAARQDGKMVNIKSATSGPWAAVFFYPETDTPG